MTSEWRARPLACFYARPLPTRRSGGSLHRRRGLSRERRPCRPPPPCTEPAAGTLRAWGPQRPPGGAPGNIALDWPGFPGMTDRDELTRIFAGAAHVARVRLVNQRIVMAPMEPRAARAEYDGVADRYILHCASQSAVALRHNLAQTLG